MNVTSKIVRINILIFFLWMFVDTQFMINHFLVSADALSEGRIWVLITSVFSHNMLFHLLINMLVFYSLGNAMEEVLGSKRFLFFFLLAGVVGSIGHSLACAFLLHNPSLPALGASGAISGVLVLYALIYPAHPLFIFGLIPLPAILAAFLFVGLDLWGLISQTEGENIPIGYGAHLGGALTGFIYYYFALRPKYRNIFIT